MKEDRFSVIWQAADGYAGGNAPHTITVHYSDVEDCETEEEFREAISDMVQDDFNQIVAPEIKNMDEACEWFQSEDKGDA